MIGGSFVALSFGDQPGLGIIEDGFRVTLPESELERLCEAARAQTVYEFAYSNGSRFVVDILDNTARMRARQYDPAAVWRNLATTEPEPEVPEQTTVSVIGVRAGEPINLQPGISLASRVSRESLDSFIQRLEQKLDAAMSEEQDSFSFDVDLRMRTEEVTAKVSSQDMELNPDFAEFIREMIEQEHSCPVASELRIRIPFTVN